MYLKDSSWVQDLALGLFIHSAYGWWTGAWRFLTLSDFHWIDPSDHVLRIYIEVFSLLGACGILAGGIVHRGHQLKSSEPLAKLRSQPIDEGLLPPLLIPSRTTHSRLFPQRNTFSYPYLFVGIPVGVRGRISKALSVDSEKRSWFNVDSADYLGRGNGHLGLAAKLKSYLHTQGVTDRDYAFAYLVTAPRFLGYSFNPVSFWYLYDSDTALKYMILEVNNTFDERRMYLLRAGDAKHRSCVDGSTKDQQEVVEQSRHVLFTETWEKDFHVSPFNSRKGTYSLRATDPLATYQETGQVHIDNTIELRSSKESAKVVAQVGSDGASIEASQVTSLQLFRFIASWWWVGFFTFPLIVWQAQKLYFRKNLHVWYRPEVTGMSVGRTYTTDERHLEMFFRAFLEHAVEHVHTPLRLIYEQAHSGGDEIVMYSPGFTYEEDHQRTLTLQVISPAFYSRFVHYAHAKEAFDHECLATDERNRTINIKSPSLLPILLDAMREPEGRIIHREQSILEQLRWSLMRRLRCPPLTPSYHSDNSPDYDITDIRSLRDSDFDVFVKQQCRDAGLYRQILTRTFLAQRFTFGVSVFMSTVDFMFRATLLLATIYACNHTLAGDILRPTELTVEHLRTATGLLSLANGVHIWHFIKG